MRQQRCGYNPFLDMVCHQRDGRSFYAPFPDETFVDASGGWHDAGDQLKYLITASNATARMMLAYELEKDKFADLVDDYGTPDAERHSRRSGRSEMGTRLDPQTASARRSAFSPGGGRPRPSRLQDAGQRQRRLRLGREQLSAGLFRRRQAAGLARIQKPIDRRRKYRRPFGRGDGDGFAHLEKRSERSVASGESV